MKEFLKEKEKEIKSLEEILAIKKVVYCFAKILVESGVDVNLREVLKND